MNASPLDVAMWGCITCSVAAHSDGAKLLFLALAGIAMIANYMARFKK